jgi:hypothetical protein
VATSAVAAELKLTGGTGLLYVGGRPGQIRILDEATEKVVGEIPMPAGLPTNMSLSQDRKRFYATTADLQTIQIVDIPGRKVIDTFKLSESNKSVRVINAEADPQGRWMILLTRTTTKLLDRFEIGAPTLVQYDLKDHKVVKTIPWPKGEEREFAPIRISPDGKLMYFFADDILIYDTTEFKQVDKWELSRPIEDGLGRIDFGSTDTINEEPGFFTGIFTVQDPVTNRRMMGIARVNLPEKNVDFFTLGPATGVSFTLAPGRKRAYGLHSEIGKYEFWTFDLEGRRLVSKTEFPGRPRMSVKTSSNGKLLYIYRAGNTIDLYEASSYRYLRTITLDAELTTDLFVMPAAR